MRYLLFSVLLVAVILTAGCASDEKKSIVTTTLTPTPTTITPTPTPTPTLCKDNCSGVCYDSSRQSCCYGTILDGNWLELSAGDCANLIYKSSRITADGEWYCGGVITHMDDYDTLGCCNGTSYKKATHHCCNGILKSGGGDWLDCGKSCYYYNTQSCCNDKIYEGKGLKCCNGVSFDPLKFSCCNNSIVNGPYRCCYQTSDHYMWSGKMCPSGMECCPTKDGQICYNPGKQMCTL
jgi:hypothetical protein